jgi:hypothetical protein
MGASSGSPKSACRRKRGDGIDAETVARTVLATGLFAERGPHHRRRQQHRSKPADTSSAGHHASINAGNRCPCSAIQRPRFPAQNFPQSNAIRDVCHVTIHSDARGLGPNRNDGRDLPAPYARDHDHDHGHRAPEWYRRRLARRRGPAATSASPRPAAWALSSMRRELWQRSAENDSFDISPLGRGSAAQGNVANPRKFRPT